jgi:hypothetical protein
MAHFTIETTYRLPIYRQRTYEADTIEQACRLAIEDDHWSGQKEDYDCSGDTYVTGAWVGEDTAYRVSALAVPSQFGENVQRKAEHFETLLTLSQGSRERAGRRTVGLAVVAAARCDRQSPGDPCRSARSSGRRWCRDRVTVMIGFSRPGDSFTLKPVPEADASDNTKTAAMTSMESTAVRNTSRSASGGEA